MTDEPDFIRRWSRRKRAARKDENTVEPTPVEEPQANAAFENHEGTDNTTDVASKESGDSSKGGPDDTPEENPEGLDLPDVDSLSSESDFKPFLKKGVPKELRNRAMRKLWLVDPSFAHLDGLNDYDGDFTDAATVVKGLKTLYKVGRGFMPDPEAETVPDPAGDGPSAEDPLVIAATDTNDEPIDDSGEPDPDAGIEDGQDGPKTV